MHKKVFFPFSFAVLVVFFVTLSPALASEEYGPDEEPAMEAQLDEFVYKLQRGEADYHEVGVFMDALTEQTPVLTQTRAWGIYLIESAFSNLPGDSAEVINKFVSKVEAYNHTEATIDMHVAIMNYNLLTGDLEDALIELEQVSKTFEQITSLRLLYFAHNTAGRILLRVGDSEEALAHLLQAAEALNQTDNILTSNRQLFITEQIARVYESRGYYADALPYAEQLIVDAIALGLDADLARHYLYLGYLQDHLGQSDAAAKSYRMAEQWAETFQYQDIIILSRNNVASIYIDQSEYLKAQALLLETRELAIEYVDTASLEIIDFNLYYLDILLGDTSAEALFKLHQAGLVLRDSVLDNKYIDVLGYLAQAYITAGDHKGAIDILIEQRDLQAAIAAKERDNAIEELQTRYRANEQAAEIELLAQQNKVQESVIENAKLQQRIFLLFGVIVILASILLFLAWRTARVANKKSQTANKELEYQSIHDPLTKLMNRRSFQNAMSKRQRKADQGGADIYPDALVILDIDFFKRINDTGGHSAGDAVLVEIAERLKKISRSSDLVVRWGGEEFVMYLREMDPNHLNAYIEKILHAISEPTIDFSGSSYRVTATLGFITMPVGNTDEADLNWERCLQIADMALYLGKVQGRNQAIGIYALNKPFEEIKYELENDLRSAIENNWVQSSTIHGLPNPN